MRPNIEAAPHTKDAVEVQVAHGAAIGECALLVACSEPFSPWSKIEQGWGRGRKVGEISTFP